MFKVIVSVLILSDTGSPTVSVNTISFETEDACRRMERSLTYATEHQALGHRYVVKSKANCEVDMVRVGRQHFPPY